MRRTNSYIWYLSLLLIVGILFGFLLTNWWYVDDTEILAFISKYNPHEYLTDPDIWQRFSPFNLTPWVLLSLKADMIIWGFNPVGYYLHQIISLAIITLILFNVLKLYVEKKSFAFIAVVMFIMSPPTLSVVSWLTLRHYLEGMGFGLLSIFFYVKAIRGNKLALLFISTLFYLMAAFSKEVYVPLPFILVFLPEKDIHKRLIYSIPFIIVLGMYALYRVWILGDNFIGWCSTIWPWTYKSAILNTTKVLKSHSGSWWIFSIVCIVIIWGLKYLNGYRNILKEIFRGIFLFLVLWTPIIPVSQLWGDRLDSLRFFFLTSLFITICYILSAERIFRESEGRIQKAFILLTFLFVLAGSYYSFKMQKVLWDSAKAEAYITGKFFIENNGRLDAIFIINQPHWFYDGLEKIKAEQSKKTAERKMRLVAEKFYGFNKLWSGEELKIFAYDQRMNAIVDVSHEARKTHELFLKTLRDKPLTVFLNVKGGTLNLQLGPYEGQYLLLEASPSMPDFYYFALPIENKVKIKLTHREKIRIFRFACKSPEGWTSISPEFVIDWSQDQAFNWSRT